MTVRAKMQCHSIEHFPTTSRIKLGAVYSTTGENADFAKATPSGHLEMQIEKGLPAAGAFEPGKYYYLDFTEAPA